MPPTYEYLCECGHHWEKEQRISDDPEKTCPSCKEKKAKRQIGVASFILRGSGWSSDNYSK